MSKLILAVFATFAAVAGPLAAQVSPEIKTQLEAIETINDINERLAIQPVGVFTEMPMPLSRTENTQ